jgi:hypothetical protein
LKRNVTEGADWFDTFDEDFYLFQPSHVEKNRIDDRGDGE